VKKSLTLVLAVGIATLLITASVAAAASWSIVAKASDSSDLYASASIAKQVRRALITRLRVSASAAAGVKGRVGCTRGSTRKLGSFAFSLKSGRKILPLPLKNATCSYYIVATLRNGGSIKIWLEVYK
jgi:hypothetical protein